MEDADSDEAAAELPRDGNSLDTLLAFGGVPVLLSFLSRRSLRNLLIRPRISDSSPVLVPWVFSTYRKTTFSQNRVFSPCVGAAA